MVLQRFQTAVRYTIYGDYLCVHYGCDMTCYIRSLTVRYTQQNTKGENTMKTTFYLDGKKTTKKAVKELIGEERLKRRKLFLKIRWSRTTSSSGTGC